MAISEEQIRDILGDILVSPLALFSFKIKKSSISMILEVVLDHWENRYGSASLDDCEFVSRELSKRLESLDPDLDFQLKVQSAGAERKLRLPDDLHRFHGLLMNLEICDEEGKSSFGVYKLREVKGETVVLEPIAGKGKKKKPQALLETGISRVKKGNLVIQF